MNALKTTTPFIVLIIFTQLTKANELIWSNNTDAYENEDILVKCVTKIINMNFVFKPTIVIGGNNEKNTYNIFYEKLTSHFIKDMYSRILIDDIMNAKSIYMQDGFILVIYYYNDCEDTPDILTKTFKERIKYLFIIFNFVQGKCVDIFEDVAKNMSKYDITYLIKMHDEDDYRIVTFIPKINGTTCTIQYNFPPTFLSTCRSKEDFVAFPLKKPQNLMKCPFKIGMASLFPFTKITNKTSLQTMDPLYENEGSDFEAMKIMSEYFNFTPDYYFIQRREENPYVITDFINLVANGTLDACAGGLYHIFGDLVEYSGVYGRQTVIWVYPVNRLTRSWQNIVSKLNGLHMFIIFYFIYSIIWYIFSKYDEQAISVSNMLFYTWGALIGTSSLLRATSIKQKILNLVYLILCIHFSAYISIKMYSFLTIVGPPTIFTTNAEIYASGMKPYLVSETKYFVNDKVYEAFANTSEECDTFAHCEELALKHNGVTVLVDSLFTRLQAHTAVNDEARALSVNENILTVYHEMSLRKDVTIINKFQDVMERLGESGIMDRLYDRSVGILTKAKADSAMKNMLSYSYSCKVGCSISLKQAAGAFYLWVIGCCLSICVFIVELIMKRERKTERRSVRA